MTTEPLTDYGIDAQKLQKLQNITNIFDKVKGEKTGTEKYKVTSTEKLIELFAKGARILK